MLHTKFQGHRSIGSGEEDFYGFYHIWAWRPSWPCDPTHLNHFSFLKSLEAVYEIWLKLAQYFLRRSHLTLWTDGRWTDDGVCLYYKLPQTKPDGRTDACTYTELNCNNYVSLTRKGAQQKCFKSHLLEDNNCANLF